MDKQPRRVLHVAQPTTEGTAVVVRDLVRRGLDLGDEVTVACPEDGDLGPWVEAMGARWARVPMTRAPSWVDLVAIVSVARLLRRTDLVVAHSSMAGAVTRIARLVRRWHGPLIFMPHGWSWLTGGRQAVVYRAFERWAARRTTTIVCVSEEEAAEGRRVLGRHGRCRVIENGVDVDAVTPAGPSADRPETPLVVLVGRLARQKGQDRAIRALAAMQRDDVTLRLVGDGPDLAVLQALARGSGVGDRVEFAGRTDALPHLRAADVVLVPSRWEGLSLALLEAMAVGKAVVGTAEGVGSALADSGVVVAEGNDDDVASAVAHACDDLLADPERRAALGDRARRRAVADLSLGRSLARHEALWDELCTGSAGLVSLLWLEATPSGSAAELHLAGTQRRIAAAGLSLGLVIADSRAASRSTRGRLNRIGRLIVRGVLKAQPGTLIVRHHPLAAPVVWAWKRRGARIVISVQGALTDARSEGGRWARVLPIDALTRWQLREADALVTVTAGLVEQLREATDGRTPVSLIPNGIEVPGQVDPMLRSREFACFAGNLAAWQGIDLMVSAARSARWPRGVDLVIIGDGAERQAVEAAATDHIVYLGPLPSAETQRWLAGALCSFSLKDPRHPAGSGGYWPFKVLEAAALGTPIVLSDAPGLPEMAETFGHGLVCSYESPDDVADAVATLHHDPELRATLSESGRATVGAYVWEAGAGPLNALL